MDACPPSTTEPPARRIALRRRSPFYSLSGRLVASASLLAISSSSVSSGSCRSGCEAYALLEHKASLATFAWVMVGRGLRPEGGVGWQGGSERLAIERGCGVRLLHCGSLSSSLRDGSSVRPASAVGDAPSGRVRQAAQMAKIKRAATVSLASHDDSAGGMRDPDGMQGRPMPVDEAEDGDIPVGQQFNEWFASALLDTEVGSTYPEEAAQAAAAVAAWRERMPPQVFSRVARGKRLVKEVGEALPILRLATDYVASLPVAPQGEAEAKATIVDLCSGFGYLAMLLSDCLPHGRIDEIVLVDKNFPMPCVKPQQHHISTDHLGCHGPIPLRTLRCNVKKESGGEAEKLTRIVKEAPGPVLLLAIHLCGTLSIRAVQLFNTNPQATFLALKPCCLPHTNFQKVKGDNWELGGYTFQASPIVTRGRYKGGTWQGEERSSLANKFKSWVRCLLLGVDVGVEGEKSVMQIKMHKDFDKHYQTAYIVASRSYGVGGDNNEDAKQRAEAARLSQATAQITRIISVLDDLKAQTDDKRDVTETCLKLLGLRKDDLSTGPDSLGEESEITPLERCRLQYRLVAAMIHPLEGGRGIPGASRAFGAVRDAFRSLVEPLGGTPKSEWRQPWERLLLGEEQGRILERGEQAA